MWHDPEAEPRYTETVELDLGTVVPSLAGPRRPQDRVALTDARRSFRAALADMALDRGTPEGCPGSGRSPKVARDGPDEASAESFPASDPPAAMAGVAPHPNHDPAPAGWFEPDPAGASGRPGKRVPVTLEDGTRFDLDHGHVVIAAITSCTNTSNPSVMLAAGLLARNAVDRGLTSKPWVKTSLAPGSKVVMDYYERAGLLPYPRSSASTWSGSAAPPASATPGPWPRDLPDGRGARPGGGLGAERQPQLRGPHQPRLPHELPGLAAPGGRLRPGRDDGHRPARRPARPRPRRQPRVPARPVAVQRRGGRADRRPVQSDMFRKSYGQVFEGDERWNTLDVPTGRASPGTTPRPTCGGAYFDSMPATPEAVTDIHGARVLAVLGDSVTTDHISPAGVIKRDSPAGSYLTEQGVEPRDFNSYGSRRGNHEVMIRGTFANIRLRNRLAPGTEGGVTLHLPDEEQMSIYDAAMRYQADGVPLVVLAGKEYGSGSSRDWAAKGPMLLGVRAVLAESYERIHRANLVGMGILPLELPAGETVESLGLSGHETFDITGLEGAGADGFPREVAVRADDELTCRVRIDTPNEVEYYRHGGILQYVLRQLRG